jgi:signal transduction histidine kinase
MSKLLAETIQTARETASDLRPGLLDDVGLAAAIEWEAKQFQRRTGVRCRFTDTAEQTQFDREQSTALFRICQELLANIANHAGATAVTIALKKQADELILEVSDNGKGIREKQISSVRSLGILGMRERTLVLGGAFSIRGKAGKGTTATVKIPLDAAQAKGH